MDSMILKKADVKELVQKTYPNYKGRKFRLVIQKTYHMENYWSDGSRSYVVAVTLDGQVKPAESFNPMSDSRAHSSFEIPNNLMLVENCIFQGRDLGIRFIVSPDSQFLPKMLKNQ